MVVGGKKRKEVGLDSSRSEEGSAAGGR